jgi:hypothetical protein
MEKTKLFQTNLFKGLLAVIFALAIFALTPSLASAQDSETGNFCVQDYRTGAVCTANDVRIEAIYVRDIARSCSTLPGDTFPTMEASLEFLIAQPPGAPSARYDIGLFLSLDTNSALSGDNCFHSYLEPPIDIEANIIPYGDYNGDLIPDIYNGDPWLDMEAGVTPTDTCGDIHPDLQLIDNVGLQKIPCQDLNGDSVLDISVCTSWDNNNNTTCTGVTTAFPGTPSKCSCQVVNLYGPTAIEGLSFSASSRALPTGLALSGLGLLLIVGVLLTVYLRRRAHAA